MKYATFGLRATRARQSRIGTPMRRRDKGITLTGTVAKCLGDGVSPGDAKYGESRDCRRKLP
jgi:hypothetical protein